jgi:hypothetical protein
MLAFPEPLAATTGNGSTAAWWIPVAIAALAAFGSYFATWVLKRRDVERDLALRCSELLNQASDLVRLPDEAYREAGDALAVRGFLNAARSVVFPLRDPDLDFRLLTAERFAFETAGWTVPRVWLGEAVENVRHGLVGYLAPPRFAPWRRGARRAKRTFPTYEAFEDVIVEDHYDVFDWLGRWMSNYEHQQRYAATSRAKRWLKRKLHLRRSPYDLP